MVLPWLWWTSTELHISEVLQEPRAPHCMIPGWGRTFWLDLVQTATSLLPQGIHSRIPYFYGRLTCRLGSMQVGRRGCWEDKLSSDQLLISRWPTQEVRVKLLCYQLLSSPCHWSISFYSPYSNIHRGRKQGDAGQGYKVSFLQNE